MRCTSVRRFSSFPERSSYVFSIVPPVDVHSPFDPGSRLGLLSTRPGDMSLPIGSPAFVAVASNPPGPSVEERIDYIVREIAVVSDPSVDIQRAQQRAAEAVRRGWSLPEMRRLMRASNKRTDEERVWQNATPIEVPMFIAHGTTDTVLPLVHGHALKELYPQAELVVLYGMCHELQPQYLDRLLTYWLPFLRGADESFSPSVR